MTTTRMRRKREMFCRVQEETGVVVVVARHRRSQRCGGSCAWTRVFFAEGWGRREGDEKKKRNRYVSNVRYARLVSRSPVSEPYNTKLSREDGFESARGGNSEKKIYSEKSGKYTDVVRDPPKWARFTGYSERVSGETTKQWTKLGSRKWNQSTKLCGSRAPDLLDSEC